MAWTSGARSVATLVYDGWFSFELRSPVGVAAGLNYDDTSALPQDIKFGLRVSNGAVAVLQDGVVLATGTVSAPAIECFVGRMGGKVFTTIRAKGATTRVTLSNGLAVPGGLFLYQKSEGPLEAREVFLDASLFSASDAIYDLVMTEVNVGRVRRPGDPGEGGIELGPMTVSGVGAGVSTGRVTLGPLTAMGATPNTGGGTAMSLPLTVAGVGGGINIGRPAFEPMTATGVNGVFTPAIAGGRMTLGPMTAGGSGYELTASGASVSFEPPVAFGSETTYSFGGAEMRPMQVAGAGWETAPTGPKITIMLPGVVGIGAMDNADVESAAHAYEAVYPDTPGMVTDIVTTSEQYTPATTSVSAWVTDQPKARDLIVPGGYVEVLDPTVAMDEMFLDHSGLVEDVMTAYDEWSDQATVFSLFTDQATAQDLLIGGAAYDLTDVADASDSQTFRVIVLVEELATADDLIDSTDPTPDVESTALASGDPEPDLTTPDVDDFATVTDEYVGATADAPLLLTELVTASDTLVLTSVSGATITDEAWARDALAAVIHTATAWVMNTESTAVSWYNNWPFTDMAQSGNKTYAIGPEGLYVVGGDTDAGTPIRARVEFDHTDFGGYDKDGVPQPNASVSRVENVYLGMTYGTPVQLDVLVQGDTKSYRYTTKRGPSDTPRNDRIVPGKGLRSRYWKLAVENTAGGDFAITDMAADVATNNRRL